MRPSQRIHNLFGASEPFSKAQFPTFGDVGKQASRDIAKEEMHCNETGKKKKMTMRPDNGRTVAEGRAGAVIQK